MGNYGWTITIVAVVTMWTIDNIFSNKYKAEAAKYAAESNYKEEEIFRNEVREYMRRPKPSESQSEEVSK